MTDANLKDTLLPLFSGLSAGDAASIEALRPFYADDMVFEDPIQKVHGVEPFIALNRRLVLRARELHFRIERVVSTDTEVFSTWHMHFRPKVGPAFEIDAASHLLLEKGRVQRHRDYWDLGALFASAVPGGQRWLRLALRPFA